MKRLETELENRILRFDGVSIYEPENIVEALLREIEPKNLRVTKITSEILAFNKLVSLEDQLKIPDGSDRINLNMDWQLPPKYLALDLDEYVFQVFSDRSELQNKYSSDEYEEAINRIGAELEEVKKRGMVDFMKTIIYVLDIFKENNIIWGVGRGSSCACYLLYIFGLHLVDCVKYKIPFSEFFHD